MTNLNIKAKLINVKKLIENYLEKISVENYNCIVKIHSDTTIKTTNFVYESFIENEKSTVSFQIFKDKKQYIFSVTGFDNLENIINEIPSIMENMEISEFYDNNPIFHPPVTFEKSLYEVPMNIPSEIINNFFAEIKEINEKENRNIYETSSVFNQKSHMLIFNKGGYEQYRQVDVSNYYVSLTEDDGEDKYTDYEYETFLAPINEKEIIKSIADRLKKSGHKINIEIGKYDVIFNTKFSYKLVKMVVNALYGDAIWRKKSFLVDKIGGKIFGDNINIKENPNLKNSISNGEVDIEGHKVTEKYLVEKGVVKTMLLNKEYGQKFNLPATGNSWYFSISSTNIYLEPGTYKDLINESDNVIVLNSIIGSGFQVHNGEISVSISGFYYKNKEFQGTINGTLNGNIVDLLSNCLIGDDIDYDKDMAPSLLVKNMTFASVSEE